MSGHFAGDVFLATSLEDIYCAVSLNTYAAKPDGIIAATRGPSCHKDVLCLGAPQSGGSTYWSRNILTCNNHQPAGHARALLLQHTGRSLTSLLNQSSRWWSAAIMLVCMRHSHAHKMNDCWPSSATYIHLIYGQNHVVGAKGNLTSS